MRHFLSRLVPPVERILVIESGPRHLLDHHLPYWYEQFPDAALDLLTCYPGLPKAFREERGRVLRVSDYPGGEGRAALLKDLLARQHNICGIICAADPIMTKWKWWAVFKLPVKLFILNENADYFWFDWSNWNTIRHFVLYRAGLSGAGAVRTIARLLVFPFAVLYLVIYALYVHATRRKVTL